MQNTNHKIANVDLVWYPSSVSSCVDLVHAIIVASSMLILRLIMLGVDISALLTGLSIFLIIETCLSHHAITHFIEV